MEFRGQICRGGEFTSRLASGESGLLVRIVNAFMLAPCDNLDIGFLIVALVKEWARDCTGDAADLHHCAHAPVEDALLCGGDLGAEYGRGVLPSWYFELQSAIFDHYIFGSVVLGVALGAGRGGDVVGADGQSVTWEGVGDGEVYGKGVGETAGAVDCPEATFFHG